MVRFYDKEELLKDNPDLKEWHAERTIAKSDRVKASRVPKSQPTKEEGLKRGETFKLAYPGSFITENHYMGVNGKHRYVKQEAKEWANDLEWMIKRCDVKDWRLPLKITITGEFKDERSRPDCHNMKLALDTIQNAIGINDKEFHTETIPGKVTGTKEPFILIKIQEV